MGARQCQATAAGIALVAAGVPLREAARRVGVAASTLVRARARAGLPALQAPRPPVRLALVRVDYSDSGPGLAGAYPGTVHRSVDVAVRAATEEAARSRAVAKVLRDSATAGGCRAEFLRWA